MNLTESIIELSEKRDNKIKQKQKVNLNKFKSFFGMASKIIQQKTINNTFSFSKFKQELTSNSPYVDIQDLNLTSQQKEQISQFDCQEQKMLPKKIEQSDIQFKDYKVPGNQSQTHRIPSNKIQKFQRKQKKENNQQEKQFRKQNQLIQQSQTTKQQAFDYTDQSTNIQITNKRQLILQRMEEEKVEKERILKYQLEANKIIKQIQERMKQKESQLKQKEEAILLTELEKRKAVMAQKRELSQPIRLNDLTEHQKKYEEDKKVKEYERDHLKFEYILQIKQNTLKFPKSQTQMRLEEEEKYLRLLKEQDIKLKKTARQRQIQYADFAQENYFREHPTKQKQSPPKEIQTKQINEIQITEQNLRKIRKFIPYIPQQRHLSQESKDSINDLSIHLENKPPKPIKKSYLLNQKILIIYINLDNKENYKIEQLLNQIKVEKLFHKKIIRYIISIGQCAKNGIKSQIKRKTEANNLYIATIKAKLAILDKN